MWLIPVLMGVGYLLGSIPSGFLIVRVFSGQDVRQMGSGRTGGTNVMRAAGFWPGLLTALLDMLKATASVWIAKAVLPLDIQPLGMALAGLCAILGHNYSLFLKFKGGAGGAPCVGGAIGIWPWSGLIIVPLGAGAVRHWLCFGRHALGGVLRYGIVCLPVLRARAGRRGRVLRRLRPRLGYFAGLGLAPEYPAADSRRGARGGLARQAPEAGECGGVVFKWGELARLCLRLRRRATQPFEQAALAFGFHPSVLGGSRRSRGPTRLGRFNRPANQGN